MIELETAARKERRNKAVIREPRYATQRPPRTAYNTGRLHGKDMSWQEEAACRQRVDLDFHPRTFDGLVGRHPPRVIEIDPEIYELCRTCPVKAECFVFSQTPPREIGIWAGWLNLSDGGVVWIPADGIVTLPMYEKGELG